MYSIYPWKHLRTHHFASSQQKKLWWGGGDPTRPPPLFQVWLIALQKRLATPMSYTSGQEKKRISIFTQPAHKLNIRFHQYLCKYSGVHHSFFYQRHIMNSRWWVLMTIDQSINQSINQYSRIIDDRNNTHHNKSNLNNANSSKTNFPNAVRVWTVILSNSSSLNWEFSLYLFNKLNSQFRKLISLYWQLKSFCCARLVLFF